MVTPLSKLRQQSPTADQGKPGRYRPDILTFGFGVVMLAVSLILLVARSAGPGDAWFHGWIQVMQPTDSGFQQTTERSKGESYFNLSKVERVDFLRDWRGVRVRLFTQNGCDYSPTPRAWRPEDVRSLHARLKSEPERWVPVNTTLDSVGLRLEEIAAPRSGKLRLEDSYINFGRVVQVEFRKPPYDDSLPGWFPKGELAVLYGDRDPDDHNLAGQPSLLGIVDRADSLRNLQQLVITRTTRP
jgi:hypothetical protein